MCCKNVYFTCNYGLNLQFAAGQRTASCQYASASCCDAVFCRAPARCTSVDDVITSCVHPRHCACVRNAPASGLTPVNQSARSAGLFIRLRYDDVCIEASQREYRQARRQGGIGVTHHRKKQL